MKRVISLILSIIIGLSAIIVGFCFAFGIVVFNESRFTESYEENELYEFIGVEESDLVYITNHMLAYLKQGREDLSMQATIRGEFQEVFGERETLHMVDVLELFIVGYNIRMIAFMIMLIALIILLIMYGKLPIRYLSFGFLAAMVLFIILGGIAGAWMVIDFDGLFLRFHETFFDNDMWLLNINTDVLIQMLPQSFFNNLAVNIMIHTGVILLIPTITSIIILSLTGSKKAVKHA